MDESTLWLIRVAYIGGLCFLFMMWLFWLRGHYAKKVIGKVQVEHFTTEGHGYTELVPVIGDLIVIPPTKKRPGRIYAVDKVATVLVDYPSVPKILSFISTKVKKIVVDDECWEPISNRSGKLLLPPVRLYNLVNEKFSQLGTERALREGLGEKGVASRGGIPWSWIIIGLLVVAMLAGGYWMVQNLDMLKAATGVP